MALISSRLKNFAAISLPYRAHPDELVYLPSRSGSARWNPQFFRGMQFLPEVLLLPLYGRHLILLFVDFVAGRHSGGNTRSGYQSKACALPDLLPLIILIDIQIKYLLPARSEYPHWTSCSTDRILLFPHKYFLPVRSAIHSGL